MEEKATACNMIFQYATELKRGFFPYVETVANVLIPLMKFYFHDGVRSSAVSTMPALLECVKDHVLHTGASPQPIQTLFSHILLTLLEAISAEVDLEILQLMVETVGECLDVCGNNCMNDLQIKTLCETIKKELRERDERTKARLEDKHGEDFDEEEAEMHTVENEREEELLAQIAELLGKVVKYHTASFLQPFSESLLIPIMALLQPERPPHDRQVGLCIFDDVIEFCGAYSLPLFQHILPPMIQYMTDPNPGVRQAAVYGTGLCAQFGGTNMTPVVPEVMKRLGAVITQPDARSEENVHPTENAISAWGKYCQYQAQAVDVAQALGPWLSWLPVSEDDVEAKITYAQLCHFIENSPQLILGASYQNLPKVLDVFALCLKTELIDELTSQRIVAILHNFQQSIPAEQLQAALNSLTPERRAKLA